jgi:hypothetical protein
MKFKIWFGLGGGFGGAKQSMDPDILEFDTEEDAQSYAYDMAIQDYEMYEGCDGLRTVGQIMEEDEVDEGEASELYIEERESWLDYIIEKIED